MIIIKRIMQLLVQIFFNIYFMLFGKPKFSRNLQAAIDLYEEDGFGKIFSFIRSWDAPYEILERYIPKSGVILDLGSGDGLLGNYLAIASTKRKVYGIELNKDRAASANKGIKNTHFSKGSIITTKYPSCSTITIVHVLHHLPSKDDQVKVLQRIVKHLKQRQRLLILEIDYKPFLKYLFSYLTDAITVPILFEGQLFTNNFYYRKSEDWRNLLESLGFKVNMKSVHKGMPFSHVLIEAVKK